MKIVILDIDEAGNRRWHQNVRPHRTDGPAIEFSTGYSEWYVNGKQLSESEYNSQSYREFIKYIL